MAVEAVERPIEREYRAVVSDNRRWRDFVPRPGDIFVCTPPKCGTTWMQTIVAAMLFPDTPPGPVMEIAPWLDARFEPIEEVIGRLDAQTHRRSIKTHTPADGIPWYPSASYIVVGRDGRDAIMSHLNHTQEPAACTDGKLAASAEAEGIDSAAVPPPQSTTSTSSSRGASTRIRSGSNTSRRFGLTAPNRTCCSSTTTTCEPTSTRRCGAWPRSSTSRSTSNDGPTRSIGAHSSR